MATNELATNLHKGLETRDLNALLQCYNDDSEIRVIDRNHPPSSPLVISGKEEIRSYYDDILGRDLSHKIEAEFMDEHYAAFTDTCRYSSGPRVITNDICELKNGKIARQTTVQAWDE